MGLYIRARRTGARFTPFGEAVKRRAVAALHLFKPFTSIGDYLEVTEVAVYRYLPVPSKNVEFKPLIHETPIRGSNVLGSTARVVERLLAEAEKRWRSLYETYLVVEAVYAPPGTPRAPLYLLVSNGRLGLATIELDAYDWIHGDRVVESLEESLEVTGHPTIRQLLQAVGALHRDLQAIGYAVERAVVAQTPDALLDITLARAVWLPTEARLLSYAIDTLAARRDYDEEAADLYDHYQPYRRDLVVSLVGNRVEYKEYLYGPRLSELAEVTAAASVIIESKGNSLEGFFTRLVEDILEPFAKQVLEQRKSEVAYKAREFVDTVLRAKLRG